jgi:hypothetical protein
MDASAFVVETDGDRQRLFADQYDTLRSGDAVTLGESFQQPFVVRWTAPEEPMFVYHGSVERLLEFEFGGSADAPTLVFRGEGRWPADEIEVRVGDETVPGFAGEYETISAGDSIAIDAEAGTSVDVLWTQGGRSEVVFSENLHPPFDFEFEPTDSEAITITSTTETPIDPGALRVVVHGSNPSEYPDIWAENYDTVEAGDSVTVDLPEDFAAVVVHHTQWRVWDVYEQQ